MRLGQILRTAAISACLALPAHADITVYFHAGGWDAFDGQDEHGQGFCGIGSHNPADGRTFSLRFPIGGNGVTFIASKPSWQIPDHTDIPVVVQVGLERPWTEQAVGSGQGVQWFMPRADVATFDAQFRRASSMTVTFPSGNESAWIISLSGSTAASNAMGRCVTDMTQRAGAPAPPPGPAAQGTTQPFGAGGNPQAAAPTQPTTPAQPTMPAQSTAPTQPGPGAPPPEATQPAPAAPPASDSNQPTQPNTPANPTH
ncbi:MAG TPA: hypothetical protein VMB34_10500 [Acetobacteraceae bacterium]|nr:hypothetical protein [Acetobacteraceae bacterium]